MLTEVTTDQRPLAAPAERYTYHLLVSSAQMPNSCKGVYKRIAILRVDHHERPIGFVPKTIREMRGVEIVRTWERLNVGTTERCAYKLALREAETALAELRTIACKLID